jgi:POT family proton-dependent oligopeptide transporter
MAKDTISLSQDQALDQHLESNGVETQKILKHPVGLFVLFFTEMWERFSYYGMRAILVLFLISDLKSHGWAWTRADALQLYALYTGIGLPNPNFRWIYCRSFTGYRKAIIIGGLIMTLGHASMALETVSSNFFYLGLFLLIAGNGLFKPNISALVGKLYPQLVTRRMVLIRFLHGYQFRGILGILMCGYLGEKRLALRFWISWNIHVFWHAAILLC